MRRQQQEKRFTNLSYPIMLSKHYIILVCLPFVDKLDYPAPPRPPNQQDAMELHKR